MVCLVILPAVCFGAEDTEHRTTLLQALKAKDKALDSGSMQDWKETLALLREADSLQSAAVTKYEIAFAATQLGHTDFALQNFAEALRLGLPDSAATHAREFVAKHITQMAHLRLEGPEGTVIFLRDIERTTLPRAEYLYSVPGPLTLKAVFRDGSRITRTFSAAPGQILSIVVEPNTPETVAPSDVFPKGVKVATLEPAPRALSVQQTPGSPGDQAPPTDGKTAYGKSRIAWTTLAAGATVSALSAAFIPITYARLSSNRSSLRNACEVQVNGPDSCAHAKQNRWQEAQSASNAIATWKTARAVSWAGLVTGLVATIGSTAMVHQTASVRHPSPPVRVSWDAQEVQVFYTGQLW
jgi:hypothetical protein